MSRHDLFDLSASPQHLKCFSLIEGKKGPKNSGFVPRWGSSEDTRFGWRSYLLGEIRNVGQPLLNLFLFIPGRIASGIYLAVGKCWVLNKNCVATRPKRYRATKSLTGGTQLLVPVFVPIAVLAVMEFGDGIEWKAPHTAVAQSRETSRKQLRQPHIPGEEKKNEEAALTIYCDQIRSEQKRH